VPVARPWELQLENNDAVEVNFDDCSAQKDPGGGIGNRSTCSRADGDRSLGFGFGIRRTLFRPGPPTQRCARICVAIMDGGPETLRGDRLGTTRVLYLPATMRWSDPLGEGNEKKNSRYLS
jgi:hypothetical protein